MRYIATFLFLLTNSFALIAQNVCTFSDNGSANSYSLSSGQVLCIESGVFTGSIVNMDYDAEIRVSHGATFQPAVFQNANGMISNKGTVVITFPVAFGSNSSIVNDSDGVFKFNASQIFSSGISIANHKNAQMEFMYAVDIAGGSTLLNEGMLICKQALSIDGGSLLGNEGVICTGGNFTVNGTMYNAGIMKVIGFTQLSANATFVNKCTFYSKFSFTNESNAADNYGYIHIYGNDAINCAFINNASFYNGESGIVQSKTFDNYGNILGSGSFTAQSISRNYGSFGLDGGGINFYDMTPTNNQIFDEQQVLPDNSVSKVAQSVYDTTFVSNNCNQILFPDFLNSPLPVMMSAFEITVPNCIPNLYWKTSKEVNSSYFELQRKSESDFEFNAVAQIAAKGNSDIESEYNYVDENLPNGNYQYRLKIVDIDGNYSFSRVSNVQVFCGSADMTNVYPNPATDVLHVALNTNSGDTYFMAVYDVTGRLVYKNTYEFSNGFNAISIPVAQFQNGYYSLLITNNIKTESFKFLKN